MEGARFLGVWVDEGLKWTGQIEQVRAKVGRLLGVLGRARAVLGGDAILSLYNGLVLPHLQYCLMVWGDFQEGRNLTLGGRSCGIRSDLLAWLRDRGVGIMLIPYLPGFPCLKLGTFTGSS